MTSLFYTCCLGFKMFWHHRKITKTSVFSIDSLCHFTFPFFHWGSYDYNFDFLKTCYYLERGRNVVPPRSPCHQYDNVQQRLLEINSLFCCRHNYWMYSGIAIRGVKGVGCPLDSKKKKKKKNYQKLGKRGTKIRKNMNFPLLTDRASYATMNVHCSVQQDKAGGLQ